MNVFVYLSLFNAVVLLLLGIYVYDLDRRMSLNRAFALFCTFLAYWSFCEFMYRQAGSLQVARFWLMATAPGWLFSIAVLLHFVFSFTRKERPLSRRTYLLIYIPAGALALVSALTTTPIKAAYGYTFTHVGSPVYFWAVNIWAVSATVIAVVLCLRYYLRTEDPREKSRAKSVSIGTTIPVAWIAGEALLSGAHDVVPDLTTLFMVWLAAFVGYGIWRYQLFEINPENAAEDIVATMPGGLILIGPDGDIRSVNRATRLLSGYGADELIGLPLTTLIDDTALARRIIDIRDGEAGLDSIETSFLTRSGEMIPVAVSTAPIVHGKATGFVVIAKDISRQKRAEASLERKLRGREDRGHSFSPLCARPRP